VSDHDPHYWQAIQRLLAPRAAEPLHIVDGGANLGEMTAQLLRAYPAAQVTAFEPAPATYARLARRFAGEPRVRTLPLALGATPGEMDFHVNRHCGTNSLFPRFLGGRRYFSAEDAPLETIRVPVTTLDRQAAERAIDHIDLLKLDTQGAELQILRGAQTLLQRQAIDLIYSEFFVIPHYQGAPLLWQLWQLLDGLGYSMFDLFKGPHGRNGQWRFGDALFVSARFRERVLDAFPAED
jgi:FkbM family methyltransferase